MSNWQEIIRQMRKRGIAFDRGLTDREVAAVEARFGFRFPPDLRAFLQTALPQGREFPNWRAASRAFSVLTRASLRNWLAVPLDGILYDIEHNGFWLDEWGTRPSSLAEAKRVVRGLVAAAPRLIPIYIHRMMPDEPHSPGNPVFSVHQTDIIHYGADLEDYLCREFDLSNVSSSKPDQIRPIRFWDIERFEEACWKDDVRELDPSTLPEEMR